MFLILNFDPNRQFIERLKYSKGKKDNRIKIGYLDFLSQRQMMLPMQVVCPQELAGVYTSGKNYAHTSRYE